MKKNSIREILSSLVWLSKDQDLTYAKKEDEGRIVSYYEDRLNIAERAIEDLILSKLPKRKDKHEFTPAIPYYDIGYNDYEAEVRKVIKEL